MKKIEKNLNTKFRLRKRVVFLVQFAFSFSSYYSLYLECLKSLKIEPYICIIPNKDDRMQGIDSTEVASVLKNTYHINNCLIDFDGKLVEGLEPDIVFLQTPYDSQRIDAFSVNNLSNYTKVCYIPYGIGIADCPKFHYGLEFFNDCWRIFFEAPISVQMCSNYLGDERFTDFKEKIVVSGSPKIEMIMKYKPSVEKGNSLWSLPKTPAIKRIIWAPHWTFEWDISGDGVIRNGYSTFINYYQFFLDYASQHPDIDLIIRAHPLTYSEIITRNLLTADQLDEYKRAISILPNAKIDDALTNNEDYMDLFFSSDAMITDGISFFTEYPITGKPLLRTVGIDNPAKLNEYGDRIVKAFYTAYSEKDIIDFIDHVVISGIDDMSDLRRKIISEELFIPASGVSVTIRDSLLKQDKLLR